MSNGLGFRARVAGMAPKVRQAALNAALRALVLGLALGRAEDDIEVGLAYISICRCRQRFAPVVVPRNGFGREGHILILARPSLGNVAPFFTRQFWGLPPLTVAPVPPCSLTNGRAGSLRVGCPSTRAAPVRPPNMGEKTG